MPSILLENDELLIIRESASIIIRNEIANIRYELQDGDYQILLIADLDGKVEINDEGYIENSQVEMSYLFLDRFDLDQHSHIDVGRNSSLNVSATYLGVARKEIIYDLYNKEEDSVIEITNNVVCLEDAHFSLDCIGTIVKGAKRSKCHQKNRCLTIDNPKMARILPILNIDENDVEASHSLSSGTIDEDVLFYMNSRGLNRNEALILLLKSYLMPSDDHYEKFVDGKTIQEMAIRKVDDLC